MQTFALNKAVPREGIISRVAQFLGALSADKAWTVEVKQVVRSRSQQQNRYLWGICYPAILAHLPGWSAEDVHEYCLGEWSGWEVIEGFGCKRRIPLKRSARLSTTEFSDFVADIQRRMAGHGIYVPDANEVAT